MTTRRLRRGKIPDIPPVYIRGVITAIDYCPNIRSEGGLTPKGSCGAAMVLGGRPSAN